MEGIEVGREEGREEGRREGRRQERLDLARKLLAEGDTAERVAHLTGLSLAEVASLSPQRK